MASSRAVPKDVLRWIRAKAYGGKVVTLEARVGSSSKKARIPNVCDRFSIEVVNTYQMLRELGTSFELR